MAVIGADGTSFLACLHAYVQLPHVIGVHVCTHEVFMLATVVETWHDIVQCECVHMQMKIPIADLAAWRHAPNRHQPNIS